MLFQQLLARGGARRLTCSALHNPFWRLQENGSNGHAAARYYQAAYLAFDAGHIVQQLLLLHFRYHDDLLGAEIRIVQSHGNRTSVMDRRVATHDFFDVLRINVFAADNEQVSLAANNVKFAIKVEAKVARVVPALQNHLGSKVGTVVVGSEHTIGFYENLADRTLRKNLAGIRTDTHFVVRQQTARRYKRHCPRSSPRNRRDKVLGPKTLAIRPHSRRGLMDVRLGHGKYVFCHRVRRLQRIWLQSNRSKCAIELVHATG